MNKLLTLLLAAIIAGAMFAAPAAAQVQTGRYTGWNAALGDYTGNPFFTLKANGTFELETEMMDGTARAGGTWTTRNTGGKRTVTLTVQNKDAGFFKQSYTFEVNANGALITTFTDNAIFHATREYRLYNPGPSAWAQKEVNEAIAIGLVPEPLRTGYQRPVTRGEFCRVAVTLYEMVNGIINPGRENFNYYTDAYDEYPAKARSIRIMGEAAPGKFDPYANLTREQAAVVLNNLSFWLDLEWISKTPGYSDAASISSWAKEAVGAVSNAGIMGSAGGNRFSPQGILTREEAYAALSKMYAAARATAQATGTQFFMDQSDVY